MPRTIDPLDPMIHFEQGVTSEEFEHGYEHVAAWLRTARIIFEGYVDTVLVEVSEAEQDLLGMQYDYPTFYDDFLIKPDHDLVGTGVR